MEPLTLSDRVHNTPPSPIRKLAHLATQAKKSGIHVYHLNIGQPDIESPREFFQGLHEFKSTVVAYEQSQGYEGLCRAWSGYMNRTLGLSTQPEQFMITVGASEALLFLFTTCCDPGDEVIVFDPTYANYLGFATVAGVRLVPVLTSIENNFASPPSSVVEKAITGRTRAILLCNPNNPTGTVYSREEIGALLELCERHNIFFVVDETYRELVYDELEPLSILHLAPDNPRVVVVDSLSKRFSLCGARIGCLLTCNQELLAAALKVAQARLAAPTLEQFAAAYMLDHIKDEYFANARAECQLRRDTLYRSLKQVPGVTALKPQGAFYTVAQLPVGDAEHFASFLLDGFSLGGRTTFISPAAGFYMQNSEGVQKARFAFVLNTKDIEAAIEVFATGLAEYRKKAAP